MAKLASTKLLEPPVLGSFIEADSYFGRFSSLFTLVGVWQPLRSGETRIMAMHLEDIWQS